jgi:RNA polymerase sigma factor (sigma-70 family)
MQNNLQRRIAREAAEDLLQRTFEQGLKKIRQEGLEDPANLGGYLYRTACKLAAGYWRGQCARQHDGSPDVLSSLTDQALSIEERIHDEQLSRCVRELMQELPQERDRTVLERYYLYEEPREVIREDMALTELQFNTVLWRARQRFGEMLRRHGLAAGDLKEVIT